MSTFNPRNLIKVKQKKKMKPSSRRWVARQLNDPYVSEARRLGYRSRAAFKIIEMDDKFHFLKPGKVIVDLGAAPGGWSQIAAKRIKASEKNPIVAIDLLPIEDLAYVKSLQLDFEDESAPEILLDMLGGRKPDVLLSDMAPNTTGHRKTDHMRILALAEMAYEFAFETLSIGGCFITKIFQGGGENDLIPHMKKHFEKVKMVKPQSSRSESTERYIVATGFKGERS